MTQARWRRLGVWGAMAAAVFAHPAALAACPVCFQTDPSATSTGVHAAVLTLGSITASVLAAFAVWTLRRIRGSEHFSTENGLLGTEHSRQLDPSAPVGSLALAAPVGPTAPTAPTVPTAPTPPGPAGVPVAASATVPPVAPTARHELHR